jgi:DNA-binding CsgD family transcriptional regulator
MPGATSTKLRLRDARDLYLLVGECRALGHDGVGWRRHLVARLREKFSAEMVNFSDNLVVGEPYAPQGWIRPTSIVDDWRHDEKRDVFWQYVRRGRPEDGNPMFDLFRGNPRLRVARRRDHVGDEAWYRSEFYREYLHSVKFDDYVAAVWAAQAGVVQALVVQRRQDAPAFSRRDAHFIKAIVIELRRLQPQELHAVDDSALTTLPRRMLQVLASLLAGCTVRETAQLLDLSAHTVQEHVKRLYKRSGAKNRADLADRYRHVAPLLVNMPLDEMPDHRQRIDEATRRPWPAHESAAPHATRHE